MPVGWIALVVTMIGGGNAGRGRGYLQRDPSNACCSRVIPHGHFPPFLIGSFETDRHHGSLFVRLTAFFLLFARWAVFVASLLQVLFLFVMVAAIPSETSGLKNNESQLGWYNAKDCFKTYLF